MSAYQRFAAIAEEQFGVTTTDQARAVGFDDDRVCYMVRTGRLLRPARNVLAVAGAPASWHRDVMVAVLSAGPDAFVSHATAAYLWRMISARPDRIEIVMRRWLRSIQHVTVHESTDLTESDVTLLGSIPITTPVRTIVDLGATARRLVPRALDTGLRTRLFELHDVARLIGRVGRRGRRGVGVIRPLVEERLRWRGIADSEMEDLFRRVCERYTLPQPVAQVEIRDANGAFVCRTDFAYPERLLRIELDSEAFHMDTATFRKDRSVQNQTELLGWRTLRYTWWDLTVRPAHVAREIRQAVLA